MPPETLDNQFAKYSARSVGLLKNGISHGTYTGRRGQLPATSGTMGHMESGRIPWTEVSTDALRLRISKQIVEFAYQPYGEAPKADSVRTLSLSLESGDTFVSFRAEQERKRQEWGDTYVETGRTWTQENGEALHPDWISRRFTRPVELSGLPPVPLHDLRHLTATMSLLAGNGIKVVQEKLGHSSRQITSDTYTSVLPEMMRAEAESIMAAVPRAIAFDVRTPLEVPEAVWHDGLAVLFARSARQSEGTRAVGAQTQPDSELLGLAALAGRSQDDAATPPSGGYKTIARRTSWSWSEWRTSTTATRRSNRPTSHSRASPSAVGSSPTRPTPSLVSLFRSLCPTSVLNASPDGHGRFVMSAPV